MIKQWLLVLLFLLAGTVRSTHAQDSWQTEWERTLIINWLLSRNGQIALQRDGENAGAIDSLRIDIPKADVNPLMRRKEGVKYPEMWNPNWMNMKPVGEVINQAMGEGKKN